MRQHDRSSDSSAELVLPQKGTGRREGAARVKCVIPEKFEKAPMKLVCPGLRHCQNHATRRSAILGRIVISQDTKLVERIGRRKILRRSVLRGDKCASVQHDIE